MERRNIMIKTDQRDDLLTPAEVAAIFRVDAKTVTRWAIAGRIKHVKTLGGHRRYPRAEVDALLGLTSQERRVSP